MGARMSALPIAQYCGQAPILGEKHGAGRAAAMSSAFHALCAGDPSKLAFLTAHEKEEIATWKMPADIERPLAPINGKKRGELLTYANSDKEMLVGLDTWGGFTLEPKQAVTLGHLDFAWACDDGVALIVDIKKSIWTTPEGPESLQLHAYGLAYAELRGCDAYIPGLWIADEGEYLFAKEAVDLASPRARELWRQIDHAAMNDGGFATGPHCRNCWSRLHCQEYVMPVATGQSLAFLKPFAEGFEFPDNSFDVWQELKRAEEVVEKCKDNLKEAVRRGVTQVIDHEKNQQWAQIEMPGRKTLDRKALEADGVDLGKYEKQGAPYVTPRWVNRR